MTRPLDTVRAVVDLAAGITIVAWPDVSVAIVAAVLGIYLVARGAGEIAGGLRPRRAAAAAR